MHMRYIYIHSGVGVGCRVLVVVVVLTNFISPLSQHTSIPIDYAFPVQCILLTSSSSPSPFLVSNITILETPKSMDTHIHAATAKAKKEEDEDDEMVDEEEEEEENEEESEECVLKRKKLDLGSFGLGKKGAAACGSGGVAPSCCQVEKCGADLTFAKTYHKRHKVCEVHSKAPSVLLNGVDQRFCQQCSRFHEVSEFDEAKRSCRRRLAGHNERRRKASSENRGGGGGEGSSRRRVEPALKESKQQCNQIDGRGGSQLIISGTSSYKNFHIH